MQQAIVFCSFSKRLPAMLHKAGAFLSQNPGQVPHKRFQVLSLFASGVEYQLFDLQALKYFSKMSKQASLDRVRATLVKLKENIDTAEDRYLEAKQSRVESDSRLEKAEEEAESYRRRIKLLEDELEKTRKTLSEKQDRLAHVEGGKVHSLYML